RDRICWLDSEQKSSENSRQEERCGEPKEDSARDQSEPFTKNKVAYIFMLRSHGRADCYLAAAGSHRERQNSVDADQCQRTAKKREARQKLHCKVSRRQ